MKHAHTTFFHFQPGDWNGFLTLGTDNLAKIVILPAVLIGTFHFSPDLVFGKIMPGLGLTLLIDLSLSPMTVGYVLLTLLLGFFHLAERR